jgi:putative membrane protein
MDADLLLTIGHHFLVFALVGILAAEVAAIRPNMNAGQIEHLGFLDMAYGIVAILVIVIGFGRVFYGAKGPDFFISNGLFWAKIGCFMAIALLSAVPTVRILGWRRASKANAGYTVPRPEAEHVRRFMIVEAILILPILVFAAMMVRGYAL